MENAPSLFALLDLVRQRPSMYVGWDDHQIDKRLAGLEMLIAGYVMAVHQHALRDKGAEAYARFPDYLRSRFGWSTSCGPISAIRAATRSDAEAWERFWQLLQDFQRAEGN